MTCFLPTTGQMFQLWAVRVDGGEGKEIYGEDYADVYAMNRLHHKASASRACNYVRNTAALARFFGARHISIGAKCVDQIPIPGI